MGIKYLWDTNTVIYYLQKQFPSSAEKFIDGLVIESKPAFSSITEIELLCWKSPTENDSIVLNNFINDALVFELEKPVKLKTVEVRKEVKIKLPDAVIAATAIVYNLVLLTRNTEDFKNISGLQTLNPWEK